MGELFETLFSLIPIALIIALRLVMSRKKKAESEEKNKLIEFLSKQGAKPATAVVRNAVYDEDAGVPPQGHWEEEDSWNEAPTGGSEAAPQLVSDFKSVSVPQPSVQASAPAPAAPPAFHPKAAPAASAPRASSLPPRLDRLTAMQRAVVLSEVLGPPKGMA